MRSNDRGYTALFSARFDAGANLQNRHRNPMVPVYRSKRLELRLSDALSIVVATAGAAIVVVVVVVVVAAFAAAAAVVVVASAVAPPVVPLVVPLAAVEG